VVESSLRARVAALAEAEPALADDLAVRGALIELVDLAEVDPFELRLPADLIRARLTRGVPLLDQVNLPIRAPTLALFDRLTVALLATPETRQPAEALLTAARGHRLHVEQIVGESIVSHDDHLRALADAVSLPFSLVATLGELAARPILVEAARRLGPALALGAWDRGYCPICGGRPIFADRGEAVARLRCGRCLTAWAWSLPRCPGCRDGRLTEFDTLDLNGSGRWTLMACDDCDSYLKVADSARSERVGALLLDDLETWSLDREAVSEGLDRASAAGYRLEHADLAGDEVDDD
jgi:FdhE protein